MSTAFGIGHNTGNMSEAEKVASDLAERHQDIANRVAELHDAMERVPERLDDATAPKAADFIKQLTATIKDAEGRRIAAKEPYLAASRTVDGFFKRFGDALDKDKASVSRRLTAYQQAKAEEERRRHEAEAAAQRAAEAEARRIADEAERAKLAAEQKAARARTDATLDAAQEKAAQQAELEANARRLADEAAANRASAERDAARTPTDLSRTRGDMGAVSSLRKRWVFTVVNVGEVPRKYLKIDDAALKEHIRCTTKGEKPAAIPGVVFTEETAAVVR